MWLYEAILLVAHNTSHYVFLGMVYLIFDGVKSLKTRVIYIPYTFISTLIIIGINYKKLISQFNFIPLSQFALFLVVYFIVLLISFLIGYNSVQKKIKLDEKKLSVIVPGSRILLISTITYIFSYFCFDYIYYLVSNESCECCKERVRFWVLFWKYIVTLFYFGVFVGKYSYYLTLYKKIKRCSFL